MRFGLIRVARGVVYRHEKKKLKDEEEDRKTGQQGRESFRHGYRHENRFIEPRSRRTLTRGVTRYIYLTKFHAGRAIPLHSPFLHFSLCKHPGNFSPRRTRGNLRHGRRRSRAYGDAGERVESCGRGRRGGRREEGLGKKSRNSLAALATGVGEGVRGAALGVAFELAYLKLGIHRSMAQHSCQVTYYNISSPVLRTPAHTHTYADRPLQASLHPLTRRATLRRRRRRRRRVLRLSVSNIYTDSRRARAYARE